MVFIQTLYSTLSYHRLVVVNIWNACQGKHSMPSLPAHGHRTAIRTQPSGVEACRELPVLATWLPPGVSYPEHTSAQHTHP